MFKDIDRALRIARAVLDGSTYEEAAKIEGLQKERARQILKKIVRRVSPEYSSRPLDDLRDRREDIKSRINKWVASGNLTEFTDWRKGLSSRSGNVLRAEGYNSKEEVRTAIESGSFQIRSIPNFGRKSFEEVCNWCGVDPNSR